MTTSSPAALLLPQIYPAPMLRITSIIALLISTVALFPIQIWALSSSTFHGSRMMIYPASAPHTTNNRPGISNLVMRKQKASDKRTARMQRGQVDKYDTSFTPSPLSSSSTKILSSSPMTKSQWKHKKIELRAEGKNNVAGGGRGRARKRLKLYNSLASYHSTFLELISEEYQMEVRFFHYLS